MIDDASGKYEFNFEINSQNADSDSDVSKMIVIKKDPVNEENDISNLLDLNKGKSEQERISELYSKQILRVLRMVYFIIIKDQEKILSDKLKHKTDISEEYIKLKFELFHITMQLTSFDDMNNYNNLMKTALELLTSLINE